MSEKKECTKCGCEIKGKPIIDFYNCEHCSESCADQYAEYRDKEYDNYVDPMGIYRAKALSEYD